LNFPYSIDRLSSEVVFGDSTTGFGGTGSLVAMPMGGGPVQTLITGLAGPVTGVRLTGDGQTIVVSHGNVNTHAIDFYDANTFTHLGGLNFNYPDSNWVHGTSALGIRSDPNIGGATDLFFNVGSEFGDHVGVFQVTISGLANTTLNQAVAYQLVFSRSGNSINIGTVTEIGSGLRNAFGFAPLPNGDLLVTDNADAVGQDELNSIAAGQIGNTIVNFGYVDDINGCYIDRNGLPVGSGCVQPIFSPPYPLAVGATDVALYRTDSATWEADTCWPTTACKEARARRVWCCIGTRRRTRASRFCRIRWG
jgi:hypothetical protein